MTLGLRCHLKVLEGLVQLIYTCWFSDILSKVSLSDPDADPELHYNEETIPNPDPEAVPNLHHNEKLSPNPIQR